MEENPKAPDSPVPPCPPRKFGLHDRVRDDVPPPMKNRLRKEEIWVDDDTPNVENIRNHFIGEGLLEIEEAKNLVKRVSWLYSAEPNVLTVSDPVTVVGDLHGQYYDLLKLFEVGGSVPDETSYLFLGDYVDRGMFACEIVFLLFAMKIKYPEHIFMLRGNHETRHLSNHFNFRQEAICKYGEDVYDLIMNTFDSLPICAVMGRKFFCTHGGLSPSLTSIEEIQKMNRFQEPPASGLMCDLLWADPHEDYNDDASLSFSPNSQRGCSFNFGYEAAVRFLEANSLLCVLRAHEVQDQGYSIFRKHPQKNFPTVITLFSAPNYIDSFNNKGAVLLYRNNVMKISTFLYNEHPYYLPNFMDGFSWSLPFVAEKMCDMLVTMLNLAYDGMEDDGEGFDYGLRRRAVIKGKIQAISKVMRVYSVLRNESVAIGKLKDLYLDHKLPQGLLAAGPQALQSELAFQTAKTADRVNLKRPPFAGEKKEKAAEKK